MARQAIFPLFLLSLLLVNLDILNAQVIYHQDFGGTINTVENGLKSKVDPPNDLNWTCDGTPKVSPFVRGCINVVGNIHDHFLNTKTLWGYGFADQGTSTNNFLAVGSPFWPGQWKVWSSTTINITAHNTYKYKARLINMDKTGNRPNPEVKLRIKYLTGNFANSSNNYKDITDYKTIVTGADSISWDSLSGIWVCQESCTIELQILSRTEEDKIDSIIGYMLGIDNIKLENLCKIYAPAEEWCINQPFLMSTGIEASKLKEIWWFENDNQIYHDGPGTTVSSQYSRTFTSTGKKVIKVRRRSTDDQYDSCYLYVNVIPGVVADFDTIQTFPYRIDLINKSTGGYAYRWEFVNNGVRTISTEKNPVFFFTPGTQDSIILTTYGYCETKTIRRKIRFCRYPTRLRIDSTEITGLRIKLAANGFFSTDPSVTYKWSFGDGNFATGKNIDHTYLNRGRYRVTLTSTKQGCGMDSATRIIDFYKEPTTFTLPKDSICYNDSITLTSGFNNARSYRWYLNGSLVSKLQTAKLKFTRSGINTINLVIDNGYKKYTYTKTAYILPKDFAEINYATQDTSLYLTTDFYLPGTPGTTYSWEVRAENGTIAHSASTQSTSVLLNRGNYTVGLTINYKNCTDTKYKKICLGKNFRDCCKGCSVTY